MFRCNICGAETGQGKAAAIPFADMTRIVCVDCLRVGRQPTEEGRGAKFCNVGNTNGAEVAKGTQE